MSLSIEIPTVDYCYKMGKDYAENGANEENCNFSLFQTRNYTEAWEQGKKEVEEQQSS